MALLGIFSRKNRSKASVSRSSVSTVSRDDDVEATDGGFVLSPPSASLPSSTNGSFISSSSNASLTSTGSSNKLKVPFMRRRPPPVLNSPLSASTYSISTSTAHDPSTLKSLRTSESSMSVSPTRPPVFPSFHSLDDTPPSSTRSLPAEAHHQRPQPSPLQNVDDDPTLKGRSGGGLFGWKNRERKKSKATKPELDSPPPPPAESFHLMSFRHIQASSPPVPSKRESLESPTAPYVLQASRPRGDSVASTDSSQRISVAAFREAQARRSSTNLARGSPSPQPLPRPISMSNSVNSDTPPPRPPRAARPPAGPSTRDSNTSSYSANDSSTSESSSAEESDSEEHSPSRSRSRLGRQRTVTKRSYRASTDLGHGSSSRATSSHHKQTTSTRSELGHGSTSRTAHASPSRGPPPSAFQKPSNASVGTRSFSLYRRQRASYSTSELTPNAAAKRASVVVAANDRDSKEAMRNSRDVDSDTSDSDSGNGSSDEDAPLASLVPPKRPGSTASHSSPGASPVTRSKPLIDLNLKFNPITGKPASGVHRPEEDKPRATPIMSPTNISERLAKVTASAGLNAKHRDLSAAKSEDNLTLPSRKSSLNWRELRLPVEKQEVPDSPVSSTTVSPPPPRLRSQTTPPLSVSTHVRSNSMSPSRVETDVLPPIPVQGKPQDDVGFRVVSRPRKLSSSAITASPSSPSFIDLLPTKESEAPLPVRYHRPHSTSFTVVSRPQSILSSLDTKPRVAPQDDTRIRNSAPSVSPHSQTSHAVPQRPFMGGRRQESPASSTGGSSNGKAPLTPNDGSDYFTPDLRANGDSPSGSSIGVPSAMKGGRPRNAKRTSAVSFQDVAEIRKEDKERGRSQSSATVRQDNASVTEQESRRRERRRSEAKAAIELGNVINGKMPLDDDEDDEDDDDEAIGANMGPRMSMMNPMLYQNGMAGGMNFNMPVNWQQPGMTPPLGMANMGVSPQQFMIPPLPPNADQAYLAAHRQALLIAKQAYQYAVAQQAMAAAADEWERGSSVSGFTPSAGMGGMNFGVGSGMNAMGGMMNGLNPTMAGMWGGGRPMFPQGPQSTYGGSNIGAPSEVGWGSASVYGENFGPSLTSTTRRSQATAGLRKSTAGDVNGVAFPSTFQRSESSGNLHAAAVTPPARSAPRQRTRTAPSNGRLPDQRSQHSSRAPPIPPSSWKVS